MANQLQSRTFLVTREPFTDFFIIHEPTPDGTVHTHELDVDETFEWFKARGAALTADEKTALEKALDHVWNFYKGAIEIVDYREPLVKNPALEPKII